MFNVNRYDLKSIENIRHPPFSFNRGYLVTYMNDKYRRLPLMIKFAVAISVWHLSMFGDSCLSCRGGVDPCSHFTGKIFCHLSPTQVPNLANAISRVSITTPLCASKHELMIRATFLICMMLLWCSYKMIVGVWILSLSLCLPVNDLI